VNSDTKDLKNNDPRQGVKGGKGGIRPERPVQCLPGPDVAAL
jgi:hypothetical protein